jgi:putative hydrolase of the HAD superfamily
MSRLLSIIGEQSSELAPIPTGLAARGTPLPGIRAVVFDIYGTLFVSGSGDISLAQKQDRESAMRDVLSHEGLELATCENLSAIFNDLIKESHEQSRANGIDHPEVEIRDIWRELLSAEGFECDDLHIERIALRFETHVNPVWPMPSLNAMLQSLQRKDGVALGIVSNAQFYTPLLFEHFLGATTEALGFDDELSIWSYEEGVAKPSPSLFEKLIAGLKKKGIAAHEAIYVGNDIRNDILPSAAAGMRTALFAGDQRSLRLRDHSPQGLPCDFVVTDLNAFLEMIA